MHPRHATQGPAAIRDRPRLRSGITGANLTLLLVTLGIAAMVGYRLRPRHEESPFRLLQLAPGMSLRDLRRTVEHAPAGSISCRHVTERFQYCVLGLASSGGSVFALLDEHERVAVIQLHQLEGTDALEAEADQVRPLWDRVARKVPAVPHVDNGDTGAIRWVTADGWWSAAMHYRGRYDPDIPMMLMVADERAVARLVAESARSAEYAKRSEFVDPTREEAAAAFEQRQGDRASDWGDLRAALAVLHDNQIAYHNVHATFASNLEQLAGMFIVGGSRLRILASSDSGWAAEATHPRFPGRSCVTYGGRVAEIPSTAMGVAITSANGVACDTIPPEARPSLGGNR